MLNTKNLQEEGTISLQMESRRSLQSELLPSSSSAVPRSSAGGFSVRAKEHFRIASSFANRCRICPRQLCGYDTDEIFAFSTPKLVRIRDSRLGVLQLLLQLAILAYVVVWQIVKQTKYLELAAPTGSLRFSLLEPLVDPTCTTGCANTLAAKSTLPYCASYTGPVKRENKPYPCAFIDGYALAHTQESSMMVTTRQTRQVQTRNASCSGDTCSAMWLDAANRTTVFPVQPERFTMQIDHNVQAVTVGVSVEMRKMRGLLVIGDQRVCCERRPIKWLGVKGDCSRCGDDAADGFTPAQKALCAQLNPGGSMYGATGLLPSTALCFAEPRRTNVGAGDSSLGIDTFAVGDIVTASGAQLDKTSFSDKHSQRYNGLQVIVSIEYRNFEPWTGECGCFVFCSVSSSVCFFGCCCSLLLVCPPPRAQGCAARPGSRARTTG